MMNKTVSTITNTNTITHLSRVLQSQSSKSILNSLLIKKTWSPFTTSINNNSANNNNNTSSTQSSIHINNNNNNANDNYLLAHPIWEGEYVDKVEITHVKPESTLDKIAYYTIQLIRFNFDWMSGYSWRKHTDQIWLNRLVFLETVAGVPGSIASQLRHLKSLRTMERDHGWIHTLLEEAENERMHLMTFIQLRQPSKFFRGCVWLSQGVFFNFFFLSYLASPRFCHRLVGYLEEEAVKTYTKLLHEIDHGDVLDWKTRKAPPIAIKYWKLNQTATMRDVIAVIRCDESHHCKVNHNFASLNPDQDNPFPPGH